MFARLSRKTGEFIKISGHINYFNPDPPEPVFCTQNDHCEGCPYPAHGFICWHSDGSCMRTDMQKRLEKEAFALG